MLEIMQRLSDDQMAVLGCLGALGAATVMLMISFHTNPKNRRVESNRTLRTPAKAVSQEETKRRAA